MFANQVSWDWSGGVKGTGTKDEFYGVLENSWQMIVSDMIPSNAFTGVDTDQSKIVVTFEFVANMDGRGNGPMCLFHGRNMFSLDIDANNKITNFVGLWDHNDPKMAACLATAMPSQS